MRPYREYRLLTSVLSPWRRGGTKSSRRADESQLPPGLVHRHGYGVGKIEAAAVGPHRQAKALGLGNRVEHIGGQAGGLATEQQGIALGEACVHMGDPAARRKRKHARLADDLQAAG